MSQTPMTLSHIVAMARNRTIGKDNDLPWHIPEDLKFFKKMTNGKIMIMGRKTFESLPGQLPNRMHIVVSRSEFVADEEEVVFVQSIDEALEVAKEMTEDYPSDVFIVGGAEIFAQTMNMVDRIYLTVIEAEIEGDTFYPPFPEQDFQLVEKNDRPGNPPFSFQTYERKKKK